jgi:hypothetical protein
MTGNDPDLLARARAQWRWRGTDRPPFADIPAQGQISVWDFPRPPELVSDLREIVVRWGELEVARTCAAWVVRETAHPPTRPPSTCHWPMFSVRFCVLQAEALSASGKVLRNIGIWSTVSVAWHRSPGAIRSPWQGQSRWLSASLFTLTISSAAWAGLRLLHNLVASMAVGLRQSYRGHSRANLAAVIGSEIGARVTGLSRQEAIASTWRFNGFAGIRSTL